MKTLQNNFTTYEQSKRLLELGMPADSADMYFRDEETRPIVRFANSEGFFEGNDYCSPCWSVGRLIEIYLKCAANDTICDNMYVSLFDAQADNLVGQMIYEISHSILDLSKLED